MGDPRPFMKDALLNAPAATSHASDDKNDPFALGLALIVGFNENLSFQLKWSGLTGVLNAQLVVECGNDAKGWDVKSGGVRNVTTASGDTTIAVDKLQQQAWRVRWIPNGVTGGLLSCNAYSH